MIDIHDLLDSDYGLDLIENILEDKRAAFVRPQDYVTVYAHPNSLWAQFVRLANE